MEANRRHFIKTSSAALALAGGFGLQGFKKPDVHITILHTNDVHSHIDPFPASDPRNPNKGGVARRAKLIEDIRNENPNTLLFDAGDIFQGTPYFNFYGGELEIKLMSMMGYDLGTIGNHEYDNGLDGFLKQLPHANFGFVSANYDFRDTVLDGHILQYKVFERSGIKIGVFGLGVELFGLVDPNKYLETKYLDPISVAQSTVKELKQSQRCDLVICLSHLGYEYPNEPGKISDLKLASATKDIDLIVGGHTHTFMPKPKVVRNSEDRNVIINQVGCYGLHLGRIDFYFDYGSATSKLGRTILV